MDKDWFSISIQENSISKVSFFIKISTFGIYKTSKINCKF